MGKYFDVDKGERYKEVCRLLSRITSLERLKQYQYAQWPFSNSLCGWEKSHWGFGVFLFYFSSAPRYIFVDVIKMKSICFLIMISLLSGVRQVYNVRAGSWYQVFIIMYLFCLPNSANLFPLVLRGYPSMIITTSLPLLLKSSKIIFTFFFFVSFNQSWYSIVVIFSLYLFRSTGGILFSLALQTD